MSPQRVVFDEPIVRVEIGRLKFPEICPICGDTAIDTMPLTIIPNQYKSLRPSLDPPYKQYVRGRGNVITQTKKTFYIPVCEEHHYTDEGAGTYRSYCVAFDGIALAFLILSLLAFGDQMWRGVQIGPWIFFAVAIFVLFISVTYILFRPGPIEQAVKVIGFDGGLRHVWLQFGNSQYREEFMKENAMFAELVKWIQRT
ncbi:MAG: hypothetical protein ACFFD6_05390 [Candidatus Thorarchaeota archaeon]